MGAASAVKAPRGTCGGAEVNRTVVDPRLLAFEGQVKSRWPSGPTVAQAPWGRLQVLAAAGAQVWYSASRPHAPAASRAPRRALPNGVPVALVGGASCW